MQRLTGENRSDLPRYYYSVFDHEISPAWSPDGTEILFVSNRGHIYGTGGFWRMKAAPASGGRGARDSLRRNHVEGAAGFFARRQADRVRVVSGAAMAPDLGDAFAGRRRLSALLRRFRQRRAALVAGRKAHRVHFQSRRQHFTVDAGDSRRRTDAVGRERKALPQARGQAEHHGAGPGRASYRSASFRDGRRRPRLRSRRCLDARGRQFRSRRTAVRSALLSYLRQCRTDSCRPEAPRSK